MEFAKEIINEIVLNRINLQSWRNFNNKSKTVDLILNKAEKLLLCGSSVSIHILLGHTNCSANHMANCKASTQIEVWTFKILLNAPNSINNEQLLPKHFKQAIYSQLYFSPTKSWFSKIECCENGPKCYAKKFQCVFKVSTFSNFRTHKSVDNLKSIVNKHTFPFCKLENGKFLNVKLKFLKKDYFPVKVPVCLSKRLNYTLSNSSKNNLIAYEESQFLKENLSNVNFTPYNKKLFNNKCYKDFQKVDELEYEYIKKRKIVKIPLQLITSNLKYLTNSNELNGNLKKNNIAASLIENNHLYLDKNKNFKNENYYSNFGNLNKNLTLKFRCETPLKFETKLILDKQLLLNQKNVNKFKKSKSQSMPLSKALLCNFEESALKGRLNPIHSVDGFKLQIAISSNSFTSRHIVVPVTTYFYNDDAPSLYMCQCNISDVTKKSKLGIQLPKKCTFQAILFNPQGSVVKIFLVDVNVSDMPSLSQTFIRQRTFSTEIPQFKDNLSASNWSKSNFDCTNSLNSFNILVKKRSTLKYLIHLWLISDQRGRVYLHSDMKMLLSNKGDDLEGIVSLKTQAITEMPKQPKYSPIL